MPDIFDFDKKNLSRFQKFLKQSPKEAQKATAGVLNTLGFQARRDMISEIGQELTVRDKNFVNRAFKVKKTSAKPINAQSVEVGSVTKDRFSGWEEQQFGGPSKQNRVSTLANRPGSEWGKKQRGKGRLKSSNRFRKRTEFRSKYAKTKGQTTRAMIMAANRGEFKGPFIITRTNLPGAMGRLKPGVYEVQRRKLRRIQTFGQRYQPKWVDWMGGSIKRLHKSIDLDRIWGRELTRVLDYKGK